MNARHLAPILVSLALGCAASSAHPRKQALTTTRRVAILGFSGAVKLGEAPVQESLWEAVTKPGVSELERKELQERRAQQALSTYEEFRAQLAAALGWEILPQETVQGLVSSSLPSAPADTLLALKGLPSARYLNGLTPADRAILAQRLGVDGLMSAKIEYRATDKGGFSLAGFGNLTHRVVALTSIRLFDASGELVWEEREVRGTKTTGSRSATSPDLSAEGALLSEASRSSFEALVGRLTASP